MSARKQKEAVFLDVGDGACDSRLQVVVCGADQLAL